MRTPKRFRLAILLSLITVGCSRDSVIGRVDDERLAQADRDTANWLTHGRTYDEQRFSPLRGIDTGNVSRLGLVWSRELNTTRGLEATPLVVDGVIYTTGSWSVVYAIDARTGDVLWTYDPAVPRSRARVFCCDVVNRGVALYKGNVYVGTLDGRLVAIDAQSGKRVWETLTVDQSKPYSITGAPRIVNGMVLIGNGGAEMGVRGYVSAYDASDGALKWRTFTVPGDPALPFESEAMRAAATTWNGRWWEGGGGGTAWDAIVYDPALDLVYVGTGNGSPWYRDLRSPGGGDNLYLSCIIALRAATGEQVWYHQTTPGDNWDYTATQPLMLADLQVGGRMRKVIMQAPKNGFFYVLDRATGDVISAAPFAKLTWATGFDTVRKRPIESSTAYAGMRPVLVSPDPSGAHGWHPMAFSPQTGLVYFPVRDGTLFLHNPDSSWRPATTRRNEGMGRNYAGPLLRTMQSQTPTGHLVAWDPVKQEARWRVDHPVLMSGGVLTTAGNLVFQGRSDGKFLAYRASDGAKLWQFDAGTGIMAPPVTYLVDGTQYVTLMVGWGGDMGLVNPPPVRGARPGYGRVLTFALGGSAPLRVTAWRRDSFPVVQQQGLPVAPELVEQGRQLYATYCLTCHGVNAVAAALPDLRSASADVHRDFERIVLGGARVGGGMPSFEDLLTPAQTRAIQAYVIRRARESAGDQGRR